MKWKKVLTFTVLSPFILVALLTLYPLLAITIYLLDDYWLWPRDIL